MASRNATILSMIGTIGTLGFIITSLYCQPPLSYAEVLCAFICCLITITMAQVTVNLANNYLPKKELIAKIIYHIIFFAFCLWGIGSCWYILT